MPFPCDDCCSCEYCSGGSPAQIDVTLANFAEWDPPGENNCGSCVDLNATYTTDPFYDGEGVCYYGYTFPSPICDFTSIQLRLFPLGIRVYLYEGIVSRVTWFRSRAALYDCLTWSTFDIPLEVGYGALVCDFYSTTCKITSIP